MPPVARTAGLMLALLGPLGLAAESPSPDSPRGAGGAQTARPALDAAFQELRAATAAGPHDVELAVFEFQSPPPSAARTGTGKQEGSTNPPTSPLQVGSPQAAPPAPPGRAPPIRLPPRRGSDPTRDGTSSTSSGRIGGLRSLITIGSSLAAVLGLFLIVAWTMRRTVPGGSALLPSEVIEVLGRSVLASRAQVHLIRCGSKLLLVSVSPTGIETLTEITDADEVSHITGLCRQSQPGSATAAFRHVFQQFAGARTPGGFVSRRGEDVQFGNAGIPGQGGRLEGRDA